MLGYVRHIHGWGVTMIAPKVVRTVKLHREVVRVVLESSVKKEHVWIMTMMAYHGICHDGSSVPKRGEDAVLM